MAPAEGDPARRLEAVPPQPLSWHVESRDGLVTVTVSGALDATAGSTLYRALMECLSHEPVAILVELSGMTVTEPDAAKIFPAVIQQAEIWPGTPVLLCAPDPTTATLITDAAGEPVPLTAGIAAGLATLSGRDELVSELILPTLNAVRRARDIVTDACGRWDLPHLVTPAALVVSELVTNAVEHAHTFATVQARLRPRHLYVAVFDGADGEPVPHQDWEPEAVGGRGLHLVELVSTRWGHQRRTDGKVVWASFATA
jgi:anti-sigma regulatory factor (Ser/Thr protein kinase)